MVIGGLLAGRLYGGHGKRNDRSVFGQIHGQDNSFHLQAVKTEHRRVAAFKFREIRSPDYLFQ